jgi:glycolate oxidase
MPTLLSDLRATLGRENVLSAPSELAVYDCDAFTLERCRPDVAVLPGTTRQVAEVVTLCQRYGAAVIARGAGTGLAGGCLPQSGGVLLLLSRLNKVLDIDLRNRMAVVEAGVSNRQLANALAGTGFHFAPDPTSQGASTVGGNVATNAGGPHALKYGTTVNHVLGLEAVLADGSIIQLGPVGDPAGLDLVGVLTGSEGTLGIVTKVWGRLTPQPQHPRTVRAIFNSVDDACNAVSQLIAASIVPAAVQLIDQATLAAVEEASRIGFSHDAGATLLVDFEGPAASVDRQQECIADLCRRFGAREVLPVSSDDERRRLWECCNSLIGASGRLSPSYLVHDGAVPRSRLPQILRRTAEIGGKHEIRVLSIAHAGDGTIHAILLFDQRDPEQLERAVTAGREFLEDCVAAGGSISAEHGVGVAKIGLMERLFAPADLDAMRRVRQAFDPTGRLNSGKLIPQEARD